MIEKIIAATVALIPPLTLWAITADPFTEGSGWVGTGLLGLVLAWIFSKHIPDKDKQMKEMLEAKDKQILEIMQENNKHTADRESRFEAREQRMYEAFREDMRLNREVLQSLKTAIEKAIRK